MSAISLTASVRSSLVSLKSTAKALETTTTHLSTGKKVASAIDNPTNYFAAANYNDRASALSGRLDGMSEATEMVNAADNGITNIKAFLSQMKGVVNDALSNTDSSERRELGKQFNELIVQVRDIAKDSSYGGINLLYGNASNTVQFGSGIGDASLTLQGFNISGATGSLGSGGGLDASAISNADGDSFALTIDTGGKNVIGIKSARGTETLSSGAQSIVDSANSAVRLANTFFASASANKTTTLASFDALMANAAAGANEVEGSAVYSWGSGAFTGTGTSTSAAATGALFSDLATLYGTISSGTAGTRTSAVDDAVEAIQGTAATVAGGIAGVTAVETSSGNFVTRLETLSSTLLNTQLDLTDLVGNYATTTGVDQASTLSSINTLIQTLCTASNDVEGAGTYSFNASTGVLSGSGSQPYLSINTHLNAFLATTADIYNLVRTNPTSGGLSVPFGTLQTAMDNSINHLDVPLTSDRSFFEMTNFYAGNMVDQANGVAARAGNYLTDSAEDKSSALDELNGRLNACVIMANDCEGSSTYSWNGTTLTGIGNGINLYAPQIEPLLQQMANLSLAVQASSGPGVANSSVTNAIAALTSTSSGSGSSGSLDDFETAASGFLGGSWSIDWGGTTYQADLGKVTGQIEDMESVLKTQSSKLANNLAIITQRQNFTSGMINILEEGADNLTLADLNEEGANLLSLQTSQSLGVKSLSLASQQSAGVLSILG